MTHAYSSRELLTELVNIPSVNPRVRGAAPGDGEAELARFVQHTLASAGVDVELQEVHPGRHNVIAHVVPSRVRDRSVLLFSAHMDTYPESAPGSGEYRAVEREGWLYGRGSADAKGSLAAMMRAVLASVRASRRRELFMVASVDEEFALSGARKLTTHGVRASLAVTGEPTRLVPIVAQKGIARFRIRVEGESAHAAYPQRDSVLLQAGRLLAAIESFSSVLTREARPDALGSATLTATRLDCDGDMNKTPRACTLSLDARFLPDDSAEEFVARLSIHLRRALGSALSFELEPPHFVSPANRCPTHHALVGELFAAIRGEAGACEPSVFSYGSEAGVLAQMADAALVFGPGDPKFSHGPGERVELREVEAAARVFERIATG